MIEAGPKPNQEVFVSIHDGFNVQVDIQEGICQVDGHSIKPIASIPPLVDEVLEDGDAVAAGFPTPKGWQLIRRG